MQRAESPAPAASTGLRTQRGFTLIEAVLVVGLIALLAAIAYPSFRSQMLKARRTDALIALMQLQQSQERWRSTHLRYGSAAELAAPATSPQGHYVLQVASADPTGFELVATAIGGQQADALCRVLRISRQHGETRYLAGTAPASTGTDDDPVNRQCWAR